MGGSTSERRSVKDSRALAVCLLGALVGVGPLLALPFPDDGGPITFVVRLAQAILLFVGAAVAAAGVYSARTGDPRPAMAAAAAVASLTAVGVAGGLVEASGGPLVPRPVWFAAGAAVLLVSFALPYALVDGPPPIGSRDPERE